MDASLDAGNDFTYEFDVKGLTEGVWNGGIEGKVTAGNVGGVGQLGTTDIILERYRAGEGDPGVVGCGEDGDEWSEVNRYFNQDDTYQQSGAAVHGNMPIPGRYRICLTGGLVGGAARLRRRGRPRHHLHDREGLGGPGPEAVLGDEHEVLRQPRTAHVPRAAGQRHRRPDPLRRGQRRPLLEPRRRRRRIPGLRRGGPDRAGAGLDHLPGRDGEDGAHGAVRLPAGHGGRAAADMRGGLRVRRRRHIQQPEHDDRARRAELGRLGPLHRAAEPRLRCVVAGRPGRDGRGERDGDDRQAAAGPLSRPRRQLVGGRAGGRPVRDVLERLRRARRRSRRRGRTPSGPHGARS